MISRKLAPLCAVRIPDASASNKSVDQQMTYTQPVPFLTRDNFESEIRKATPIVAKVDLITAICAGKSVLDVGCVDHSVDSALAQGGEWLHARIARVAREVVGLDRLEEAARELCRRGYAISVADAESFDLGRGFDVIVAADVIEHLSNVGMFLEAAKRHMHEGSLLVITTPNPFNAEFMLRAMNMGRVDVHPEHTHWLDPKTLHTVVSRHGFAVTAFHWIDTRFHFPLRPVSRLRNKILNWFAGFLFRRRPVCRRDFAVICQVRPSIL